MNQQYYNEVTEMKQNNNTAFLYSIPYFGFKQFSFSFVGPLLALPVSFALFVLYNFNLELCTIILFSYAVFIQCLSKQFFEYLTT